MKKIKSIFITALLTVFVISCFTGCKQVNSKSIEELIGAGGGILHLKVNPEIAVSYDALGNVIRVEAENDDAKEILENYSNYKGKTTHQVVSELVAEIGQKGYFVEEIEGDKRNITIEVEQGSKLPSDVFLDEVINDVKECVAKYDWNSIVDVKGEEIFDLPDYDDSDDYYEDYYEKYYDEEYADYYEDYYENYYELDDDDDNDDDNDEDGNNDD